MPDRVRDRRHAANNPQGAKLLVATAPADAGVVERPAGAVVPVQNGRRVKYPALDSIAQLNPQLNTLVLEGSGGTSKMAGLQVSLKRGSSAVLRSDR